MHYRMCKNRIQCHYWKKLYYWTPVNFSLKRVIISDNCKILDDSNVTPDTLIPPYTVFGGNPGFIKKFKIY